MEESRHWENLKSGSSEALEALYNLHIDRLYAYGMMLCQDEEKVKDCIQELFLAFWNNRANLTIPTSGKAYLVVSLRRRIFDKGPKSNLVTTTLEADHLNDALIEHPEKSWLIEEDHRIQQQRLEAAMAKISDRQREILHMRFFLEMDYDQIAAAMDLNYQSARNLVTRALAAMRKAMYLLILILCI
jgi:RNA polymerase sigma factor (sigma-70 family)